MSNARANILARLRAFAPQEPAAVSEPDFSPAAKLGHAERIAQLERLMEAMHAEVIVTDPRNWIATLKDVLRRAG